jgi:asparagine synthase (glutamine-hydrolysing)
MSGICGICEPGRVFSRGVLHPMLESLALPADGRPVESVGENVALGTTPHWSGQELASIPGVRVALDADLIFTNAWEETLQRAGAGAGRMSLAERVAWLYLSQGVDFLDRLEGAFSLALWDEKQCRLLLAIDRAGIRQLYWRREGDRLTFASRVGALCAAHGKSLEINPAAVMQYLLFTAVPAPLGIYRGVQKLEPGHCLLFEAGQVKHHQYWDMKYPETQGKTPQYWAQEVREGIRAAVHRHLENCVPERTGAYLSGGTDSSSVVAFVSERFSPANTFSIYFAEERYSEIGYARITAKHFKTKHCERRLTSQDALAAIPKICSYYDEPFANSSAIGAYYCALMARESGVGTLLAGDGGDEIFAGNERYASDRKFARYHALPSWLRKGLIEPTASVLPLNDSWLSLPRRYIQRARIPNPRRIFSYGPFFSTPPEEVFERDFLAEVPPDTWMQIADSHFNRHHQASDLNRMMYFDLKIILADNDLRKVSGTAELAGVRTRFPFLDRRLAELTGRIPTNLKLRGAEKRFIFKCAMRGILPDDVLAKKKHGFGVPLGLWLFEEPSLKAMVRDVLGDVRTRQRGYVRPQFVDRLLTQQAREDVAFYGEAVWCLLALELWHRQHTESSTRSVLVS